MSKKQLLEETTIRKFMKLANLEPLSDRFIEESMNYNEESELDEEAGQGVAKKYDRPEMDSQEEAEELDFGGDEEGGEEIDLDLDMDAGDDDMGDMGDVGAGVSPEVAKKVVQAVLDALGVEGTVEDDEEGDMEVDMDSDDSEDFDDMDMGDEEDEGGEEESDEEGELEESDTYEEGDELEEAMDEEEEMKESLSRDELVENVLRRVTARLISEAKKDQKGKGKKPSAKDVKKKMQDKKNKKKLDEEKHHMKTHKKQVGGLASKGKNKDKLYNKHQDMEYTEVKKGGKGGGKGGHEMKPLKASGGHTKTHKSTSSVTTKGTNKHK